MSPKNFMRKPFDVADKKKSLEKREANSQMLTSRAASCPHNLLR